MRLSLVTTCVFSLGLAIALGQPAAAADVCPTDCPKCPFPLDYTHKTCGLAPDTKELETTGISGGTQIARYRIVIKTGTDHNAGTDANVWLGLWTSPGKDSGANIKFLDKPGNDFENGSTFDLNWAINQFETNRTKVETMSLLRTRNIYLWHDSRGKHPGWQVAEITLSVCLVGTTCTDTQGWRAYKRWKPVGWLDWSEKPYATQWLLQHERGSA